MALSERNDEPLALAINRAKVVFPTPGGPYKITLIEPPSMFSIILRKGEPSPRAFFCPSTSSSDSGLMRAAKGMGLMKF
jgi:hypothetical protein